MSGDLFVLLSLGLLLAFVLWEMWCNRPSSLAKRARSPNGFIPGGASHELALFVLAAVFSACGLLALYFPGMETSGRSARIFSLIEFALGAVAVPFIFFAGAVLALLVAFARRKRRLALEAEHAA